MSFFRILSVLTYLQPSVHNKNIKLEENNEIISNLKFIAKIKIGEQINVDSLSICNRNFLSGVYRSLHGESRDKTFDHICLTIKRAFEKLQAFIGSDRFSDKMLCINLIQNLVYSIDGLNNLKETYKEDRSFVCNLETLIENIQNKLDEIKESKPSYFDNIKFNDKNNITYNPLPSQELKDKPNVNLIKKEDNNKK